MNKKKSNGKQFNELINSCEEFIKEPISKNEKATITQINTIILMLFFIGTIFVDLVKTFDVQTMIVGICALLMAGYLNRLLFCLIIIGIMIFKIKNFIPILILLLASPIFIVIETHIVLFIKAMKIGIMYKKFLRNRNYSWIKSNYLNIELATNLYMLGIKDCSNKKNLFNKLENELLITSSRVVFDKLENEKYLHIFKSCILEKNNIFEIEDVLNDVYKSYDVNFKIQKNKDNSISYYVFIKEDKNKILEIYIKEIEKILKSLEETIVKTSIFNTDELIKTVREIDILSKLEEKVNSKKKKKI